MSLFDRVFSILYVLIVTALAVIVLAISTGWNEPLAFMTWLAGDPNNRLGAGIIAAVVILIGLRLLLGGLQRPSPAQSLIQTTSLGDIRITLGALEGMVTRAAHQVRGLKEVRPVLRCLPQGVAIFLQASVGPEINITQVSAELQEKVRSYIEELVGVQVVEIRVLVDDVVRRSPGRVQ